MFSPVRVFGNWPSNSMDEWGCETAQKYLGKCLVDDAADEESI